MSQTNIEKTTASYYIETPRPATGMAGSGGRLSIEEGAKKYPAFAKSVEKFVHK